MRPSEAGSVTEILRGRGQAQYDSGSATPLRCGGDAAILAPMELSRFGEQLTTKSGILALMDDLGEAMATPGAKCMLGGGNPAHIPELDEIYRRRMGEILQSGDELERMLGNYDTPRGRVAFLEALADLFRREQGWDLDASNIAITNGSQTGYFMLLNMLSGQFSDGSTRRMLFPLMPEYIGYANQSVQQDAFEARLPWIEQIDETTHKYRVDLESMHIDSHINAICVSRPTNPTGNVLTDNEVATLDRIARENDIPLLLDNAYGIPFPGMIFTEATPIWNENIVLAMSLSKIGLPSTRTGIVVARREIIEAISSANAIVSLANGSVGQAIMQPMIESGEILRLSQEVVKPFYYEKSRQARAWVDEFFEREGVEYSVHVSEGSLFLWIWFKSLRSNTYELYHKLKERNTIVVPGRYFSFGLEEPWDHADQCIRVNYGMDAEQVRRGIEIIAEEAAKLQK